MAPLTKWNFKPQLRRRHKRGGHGQRRKVKTGEIPNEILSQILSRCDNDTLQIARQTCHRWKALIDETIGVSAAIGSTSETSLNPPITPFQPIEIIEKIGVKNCYVGQLVNVEGCPFRYPQTVRRLELDGPITNFNLVTLIAPLPSLTHLTIHYSALEDVEWRHELLQSGSLKTLRITAHIINSSYDLSKANCALGNIINLLLSLQSQQLEVLIMDIVYIPEILRAVTIAIATALLRHKHTMKIIQCYHTVRIQEPDPPGVERSNIIRESSNVSPLIGEKIISRAIKEVVNLKRICYAGLREMESDDIWTSLITSQKNLQEIFYMTDKISSTGSVCLEKNASTLKKILFHINAVDENKNVNVFDCEIFKKFSNLSHLLIRGRQVVVRNIIDEEARIARIAMKVPILRNVHSIPETVRVLSFRDILVVAESLSKFKSWMTPNLIKFRLVDAGTFGDYGIKPETFLELLKCEQLEEIEIIKSFNRTSWDRAAGKDIFEESLFYKIKECWSFHAKRGESGKFCFKNVPMFNYGQPESSLRANDVCDVIFE